MNASEPDSGVTAPITYAPRPPLDEPLEPDELHATASRPSAMTAQPSRRRRVFTIVTTLADPGLVYIIYHRF